MPVEIRELPFDEWHKLGSLPVAANGLPSPDVLIMVAEDENGEIVGVWTAGPILMLEGLWVSPEYRKRTSTLWQLFTGMLGRLKEIGVTQAHSIVQTQEMLSLAEHGGFHAVDGQFIAINLEDK